MRTTPLGESLWWVLQEFSQLRESRKIIIIVTDGEPSLPDSAKAAVKEAALMDVEVYGLGLKSESVLTLLPGRSATITNL
jgi:Mg-chelatase subunit ChlD